jgi:hypothetical protein
MLCAEILDAVCEFRQRRAVSQQKRMHAVTKPHDHV